MPIPFPNYFEFESINANYQLNPETKEYLTDIWRYMTRGSVITSRCPEGLFTPNGVKGIQDKMEEVRYLAIVPRDLAEEIRKIIVEYVSRNRLQIQRLENEQEDRPDEVHPMTECPSYDETNREMDDNDPYPELPCPWPWEIGTFSEQEQPIVGYIMRPTQGIIRNQRGFLSARYIITYDYCGQYFGSAKYFYHFLEDIPGMNNYSETLKKLKECIDSNGDAPLIVLCSENIVKSLSRLQIPSLPDYYDIDSVDFSYYFGLKKVLIHEMGHHVFPVITAGNSSRNVSWPECMANWFCHHFLDDKERFILHIWSLHQPVQYQCYKALLGLSMSDDMHCLLGSLPSQLRNEMIIDSEKMCSFYRLIDRTSYIDMEGMYLIDRFMLDDIIRSQNDLRKPQKYLITHAEALFKYLIRDDQYRTIFDEYTQRIRTHVLSARRATKSEYHKMLIEEGKKTPSSLGFLRRNNDD